MSVEPFGGTRHLMKQTYSTPDLVVYGDVVALTQKFNKGKKKGWKKKKKWKKKWGGGPTPGS